MYRRIAKKPGLTFTSLGLAFLLAVLLFPQLALAQNVPPAGEEGVNAVTPKGKRAAPVAPALDTAPDRRDIEMGVTEGNIHIGRDSRGDEVMQISPRPKQKQEVPDIGPILVVPQINTPGPRR